MTPPNATPTRADVLREFSTPHVICTGEEFQWDGQTWDEPTRESLADEVLRLRTRWDAMIRRVEALPRYFPEQEFDGVVMAQHADGYWLRRVAVLAALREGGDA